MNKTLIAIILLVVGLANAAAIWLGFGLISKTIQQQRFYSTVDLDAPSDREVVALSGDRFAVVERSYMSVYQVEPKGEITRVSDVETFHKELRPRDRREYPPKRN